MDTAFDHNEALLEAGLALASELSLPAVLQRIVDLAVRITGARFCALGVVGSDGRIGEFITTGVTREEREAIGALPVGRGILGLLIREAAPLRIADIQSDPRSVGFPPNHPAMRSFLGAPVKARGQVFGNIYLTEKQGADEFSEEDERALVVLATQAGVAVENASLYEQARRRERRLEAVRELATLILEGTEPEDLLPLVAERARQLVGADIGTIAVPGSEGKLVIRVAVGTGSEALEGVVLPMEGSISGQVIRTGRPVVLVDAQSDERIYQPLVRMKPVGPAMFVPLYDSGEAFGTLAVANLIGGRAFSDEDLTVVETFAGQASVAVQYGRARRELQRLTVLEDRERIAKDLHDGVIQALFAVGMGLQATAAIADDPETQRRIEGTVADIDRVIRDLRNYIFGLRPGILADRQLDQALRELAREFEQRSGVLTIVDVDSSVAAELSSHASDLVQLVREALSNVGRHAEAATCRITLGRRGHLAVLEVDDDGRGFDVAAAHGGGFGLSNLQERAARMGGDFLIEAVPGEGTTVRVTLPL